MQPSTTHRARAQLSRNLLTSALLLALLPATTLAQTTEQPSQQPANAQQLDRILVTGSRIARAGFDTLEPAQVIEREQIETLGITNVAEALFLQPTFSAGASYRGGQSDYGAGVNFSSRFSMGSQRELTLVNGRRFVSSNPSASLGPAAPGQQVDLNVIPAALIQRVETIGIGGAPTYGSDAISGVTNVILRQDFEGVEYRLGIGSTTQGDNIRFNASSTFGRNFADGRGNFTATVAHDKNDAVRGDQRQWYRQGLRWDTNPNAAAIARFQPDRNPSTDGRYYTDIGFDTGSNDGIPGTVLIRNARNNYYTRGGLLFPITGGIIRDSSAQLNGFGANRDIHYHFDENGRLAHYDVGMTFGVGSSSGGDGADGIDTVALMTELERSNLFVTSRYDITDNVRVFGELSAYYATAREPADHSSYNLMGSSGLGGPLLFSVDNPYLHADDRATLQGLGVQYFRLSRGLFDLVERNASSRSDVKRFVVGADGWFDIGNRSVDWEVSLNHGRAAFEYNRVHLNEARFRDALNVTVNSNGQIVCASGNAGCAPLNLFGDGSPSEAARAYMVEHTRANADNRQTVFNANATVGLFDLPGGEVRTNFGYEQRHERSSFEPSAFEQEGRGRATSTPAISGRYRTHEGFVEVLAPVFGPGGNVPGIHRLDATVKARRVNNSLAGNFNAWTYGLQWEPIEGVQLRGNKTRSFRAPSIAELYEPVTPIYTGISEPCTVGNIGGGSNPSQRAANCASFFAAYPNVDPATFSGLPLAQLSSKGGNMDLRNEKANSWTAGIILKPTFARGLTVAADYYNIALTDVIQSLGSGAIVSACFDNPEFNAADVANANPYCSLITRNDEGQATSVAMYNVNGEILNFKGWTNEVRYQLNLADHGLGRGRVSLGFLGYFPTDRTTQVTPVVAPVDVVGTYGFAKRQYQWSASWAGQHLSLGLMANYTGATALSVTESPERLREQIDISTRDSFTMWHGFVGYRFNEQVQVNLAVQNLRNQIGPFPHVVDALGRRFMLTTRFSF